MIRFVDKISKSVHHESQADPTTGMDNICLSGSTGSSGEIGHDNGTPIVGPCNNLSNDSSDEDENINI